MCNVRLSSDALLHRALDLSKGNWHLVLFAELAFSVLYYSLSEAIGRRETLIFCLSGDGYATVSAQQVRHTDSGML